MTTVTVRDNLETLPDAELNELFAVEVAGWHRGKGRYEFADYWYAKNGDIACCSRTPTLFSADANQVLPWVEKEGRYVCDFGAPKPGYRIFFPRRDADAGYAPTFARAAVIALLRAKGSAK